MTSKHYASGKWVARKIDFKDGLVTIAHCGGWRVGVETGIQGGNYRDWDGGNDEDHARLFAAAPDLLAALEAMYALHTGEHGPDGYNDARSKALAKAEAALDAATHP